MDYQSYINEYHNSNSQFDKDSPGESLPSTESLPSAPPSYEDSNYRESITEEIKKTQRDKLEKERQTTEERITTDGRKISHTPSSPSAKSKNIEKCIVCQGKSVKKCKTCYNRTCRKCDCECICSSCDLESTNCKLCATAICSSHSVFFDTEICVRCYTMNPSKQIKSDKKEKKEDDRAYYDHYYDDGAFWCYPLCFGACNCDCDCDCEGCDDCDLDIS